MTSSDHTVDTWLRRVQSLLAKAASTQFPAEAEALMAKAQALMTRHAIDEAMLAAAGRRQADDRIVTTVVVVETPYAGPKSALLHRVANANHSRMVIQGGGRGARTCVLVGHSSDIDNVTALFTALSLHATRAMLAAEVPPGDAPRRFRHAFLLAFAWRIGERLREASAAAAADAERERDRDRDRDWSAGRSVELVLRDRSDAVDRALAEQFPHLRSIRTQASSHAGFASGRAAADTASLGQAAVRGHRGGLPSA